VTANSNWMPQSKASVSHFANCFSIAPSMRLWRLHEYHAASRTVTSRGPLAEMLQRADAGRLAATNRATDGAIRTSAITSRVASWSEQPTHRCDVVLKRRVFIPLGVGDARLAGTSTDLIGFEMGEHRATIQAGSIIRPNHSCGVRHGGPAPQRLRMAPQISR